MVATFGSSVLNRFDLASQYEWLETNGLGGYASSTIIGTNTRRYHGLLTAATAPPVQRTVLLSKMDEAVLVHNRRYELGCNKYRGTVYPNGYIFQESFKRDLFPEFTYKTNGIRIRKTIACVHGENTTIILYEVLNANAPFTLELLPLAAPRDHHALTHANGDIQHHASFENNILRLPGYEQSPDLYISAPESSFEAQSNWYYNFEYPEELARGMEGHEDLFNPGKLYIQLDAGMKVGIIISTENPAGRDVWEIFESERIRRLALLQRSSAKAKELKKLVLAADQFIVKRGEHGRSVIAGYPWFTDWGRDTMIALPGLCLATGREEDAKKIFRSFVENISQGMIPNRFPDADTEAEYNTIDASLWFFIAAWKYLQATKDRDFVLKELLPAMKEILKWHRKGTRYNIIMDEDGLLQGGAPKQQLTWMDAKAGDWVVTPREGKCVEINALWYNAWKIYETLLTLKGKSDKALIAEGIALKIRKHFVSQFWNEEKACLYDCINGHEKDDAIRPNQLFAISLPFPLLVREKAAKVLAVVTEELYAGVGLRSLSPKEAGYIGTYEGDVYARDGAYHQGTVWSWLLGPYMDAIIAVKGSYGHELARRVIQCILPHMEAACVGSISEIFDGDSPYHPRGCFAQAWSVAEVLRVTHEYKLYDTPQLQPFIEQIKWPKLPSELISV